MQRFFQMRQALTLPLSPQTTGLMMALESVFPISGKR